jgi:mannose-6-phosphate isomerase-like protein (cupin superfamily)
MVDSSDRAGKRARAEGGTDMSTPTTTDQGPEPFVIDIERATLDNENYRTTLWTGRNLQMTVMHIDPGHDIGLEVHTDGDQFLRIERGRGRVQMGPTADDLPFDEQVEDDWVILVPAGAWHNVTNVGDEPLKVYALYAPPEHPHGTVHGTKAESDAAEHH